MVFMKIKKEEIDFILRKGLEYLNINSKEKIDPITFFDTVQKIWCNFYNEQSNCTKDSEIISSNDISKNSQDISDLQDMGLYIAKYHIDHGCEEKYAQFLAWMNSNWTETNGYFEDNKNRISYGYEIFNVINNAILEHVKDRRDKGIVINHFEIMEGIYREMYQRYRKYIKNDFEDIDIKNVCRVVHHPEIRWWELC